MATSNITKKSKTEIEIFTKNGDIFTTSLDIAEKFGKVHKNVIQAIENSFAEQESLGSENANFSRLNFQPSNYTKRGKTYPLYNITKDGFSLLAMGFTGKEAMNWKIKYINAFNYLIKENATLREFIFLNATDPEKQILRLRSIAGRRIETDAIQELVDYAMNNGSQNAKRYYGNITSMTYDALFDVSDLAKKTKKLRDLMSGMQLCHLTTAESIIAKIIRANIIKQTPYKDIYKLCKEELVKFGEMVGVTAIPQQQHQLLS